MIIRDHTEAREIARAYAWARQDEAGTDQDMDAAAAFADAWADAWLAHREGGASGVNLAASWANFLRDATVREPHECVVCGLTAQPQSTDDVRQRRCGRCAARPTSRPDEDTLPADRELLAHLYGDLLVNTGGNPLHVLLGGATDPRVNLPLAVLEAAVQSQAGLLENLARADLLRRPGREAGPDLPPREPTRPAAPPDGLRWTSAGTSDPGDQLADSVRVRGDATDAHYLLGPAYTSPGPDGERWALRKIHERDGVEVADVDLGLHPSEQAAKEEADGYERHGI